MAGQQEAAGRLAGLVGLLIASLIASGSLLGWSLLAGCLATRWVGLWSLVFFSWLDSGQLACHLAGLLGWSKTSTSDSGMENSWESLVAAC